MNISLIVPVYNAEKVIMHNCQTFLSALDDNSELILVNDGSSDNSAAICDEFAKTDSRVKIIHKENEGAGSARNAGINLAQGEYITFCDIDDYIESEMVKSMENIARTYRTDLVICGNYIHNQVTGKVTVQQYEEKYITNKSEAQKTIFYVGKANWCKLYRADLIKINNIRFPNQRRAQDILFNLDYYDYISNCYVMNDVYYHYTLNTIGTLKKKFPVDVYPMYCNVVSKMYDKADKWGIQNQELENKIGVYLLAAIDKCISVFSFSELPLKEKRRYILSICNSKIVLDSFKQFKTNFNYIFVLKYLITHKLWFVIHLLILFKHSFCYLKKAVIRRK